MDKDCDKAAKLREMSKLTRKEVKGTENKDTSKAVVQS